MWICREDFGIERNQSPEKKDGNAQFSLCCTSTKKCRPAPAGRHFSFLTKLVGAVHRTPRGRLGAIAPTSQLLNFLRFVYAPAFRSSSFLCIQFSVFFPSFLSASVPPPTRPMPLPANPNPPPRDSLR